MNRDDRERELFDKAFILPASGQPFDVEGFLGGFTVEERRVPIDPDSPLGRAMAEARASWGEAGPPDPAAFVFPEPRPVDVEDE